MHRYWKLLILVLLAIPVMSIVGCGPSRASSDVTPENTGDDSSEEDNAGDDGGDDDE
jgi:hypothetical protein